MPFVLAFSPCTSVSFCGHTARSGTLNSSFHPSLVHHSNLPILLLMSVLPPQFPSLTYPRVFLRKIGPFRCDKLVRVAHRRFCGAMAVTDSQTEHVSDIEAALLDAELFIKYQAPERAIKRLRTALELNTRSIKLRERLREVCGAQKHNEEAARQCLALASLYI